MLVCFLSSNGDDGYARAEAAHTDVATLYAELVRCGLFNGMRRYSMSKLLERREAT